MDKSTLRKELKGVRTKKTGVATKLIVLILLLAVSLSLMSVRAQMQTAQEELDALQLQVYSQTEINAGLMEDIADAGDPGKLADIAREKLGLVEPGERVFASTNN